MILGEKYIVIIDVKGLEIPYSMKIQKPNQNYFFLYPEDFAEKLEKYNKDISILKRNPNDKSVRLSGSFSESISTNPHKSTFILTESYFDLSLSANELYHKIREEFYPLLMLFSFFLMEIFEIKRIFIFKRKDSIYKFIRFIQIKIEEIQDLNSFYLIDGPNRFVKSIEIYFPLLLFRFLGDNEIRKKYLPIIEDYLYGKLRTQYIEIQIIRYWNALENLADIFWNYLKKDKLLTEETYEKLKEIINKYLDTIKPKNILFPNTNNLRVKEILNSKINNFPAIKDKIFYLCSKISFDLNEDQRDFINKMYWVRNELFHRGTPLRELANNYSRKYNIPNFTLRDLSKKIINFGELIEKIFLYLVKFFPKYIYVENKEDDGYQIYWNENNLSPNYIKERLQRINQNLIDFSRVFFPSKLEKLNILICNRNFLVGNTQFVSLLKYIQIKLIPSIENNISYDFMGILHTPRGDLSMEIRFRENLYGSYKAFTRNSEEIRRWMDCKGSIFKSNSETDFHGYYLKFEFIPVSTIYRMMPGTEFKSVKEFIGFFEAMIIDIKNF